MAIWAVAVLGCAKVHSQSMCQPSGRLYGGGGMSISVEKKSQASFETFYAVMQPALLFIAPNMQVSHCPTGGHCFCVSLSFSTRSGTSLPSSKARSKSRRSAQIFSSKRLSKAQYRRSRFLLVCGLPR